MGEQRSAGRLAPGRHPVGTVTTRASIAAAARTARLQGSSHVELPIRLEPLVIAAMEPFGVGNGRSEHFLITGENIRVTSKVALALFIAFHELATNAVKYGAFSNKAGSVSITWALEQTPEGGRLNLRWQEKNGPPVTAPSRKGFGTRVIERGLAHELEGTALLEYLLTA